MNTAPMLRGQHCTDQRPKVDHRESYFWQSALGLRDPPELTDLSQLARLIRSTFNQPKEIQ